MSQLHLDSTPGRAVRHLRCPGRRTGPYLVIALAASLLLLPVGSGVVHAYGKSATTQGTVAFDGKARVRADELRLAARRKPRRSRRRSRASSREQLRSRPAAAPQAPARVAEPPPADEPEASPPAASGELRRGARVEFDGRLVQGQTAQSGAIYLFARKRSELNSMIGERTNFREAILQTVYPKRR